MVIKGTVERIIFRNSDNGYTVLLVEDENNKLVTAVGIMPPLSEGSMLEIAGELSYNNKYGDQFNVRTVRLCVPTALDAMAKYLASGLFKGVGESTADSIVEKFGKNTFDIIRDNPARLAEIKGVSVKKAMNIHTTFMQLEDMQEAIVYLQGLEISLNLAIKIYKAYGKGTRETVINNPYKLVEDIDGVGFYSADKIASAMGIARDSSFRITAGLQFVLMTVAANNGHSYLPKSELIAETAKLLTLDIAAFEDKIAECLADIEISGKVIITEREGESRVMFYKYFLMERSIATRLIAMQTSAGELHIDLDGDIRSFERLHGIKMHDGQIEAVKNAVRSGVNVVTGGPGTGKTTIIKCIIGLFKNLDMKVQLCAPTGRAAKRLSESTGEEAKTIHRLLDLDFKDGKGYFTYNENTQLDCDVVIVDEVSMCDEYVFNALVSAIKRGGRLIMVGDKDQLPSVGVGNVLSDIISSETVPVSYLTHIYRQSEESLIIENAHRINRGVMPILRNQSSDFLFNTSRSPEEVMRDTVQLVTHRIPTFLGVSPKDIQVLCPLKRGVAGANNLNIELQKSINPARPTKKEMKIGDSIFREGDKVIHTMNDYDLEWEKDGEQGVGVFNGDIGEIIKIGKESLVVKFDDGRIAEYNREQIKELLLAYAISVHKSQGSEFDVVVIALTAGAYTILTRNLLYTAVTRAKKMSVIVGETSNLQKMVRNNYTAKRYTMLKEFMLDEKRRRNI